MIKLEYIDRDFCWLPEVNELCHDSIHVADVEVMLEELQSLVTYLKGFCDAGNCITMDRREKEDLLISCGLVEKSTMDSLNNLTIK